MEKTVGKAACEWTEDDLEDLEWFFDDYLNSEVHPDELGMYQLASHSPYGLPIDIWFKLDDKLRAQLDWDYIEGDSPGSSFSAIEYLGSTSTLNRALARAGLNLVVK